MQRRRRGSNPNRVDAGTASNVRRERQEFLIKKLARDNGVLERKVAGYRLALQVTTPRLYGGVLNRATVYFSKHLRRVQMVKLS